MHNVNEPLNAASNPWERAGRARKAPRLADTIEAIATSSGVDALDLAGALDSRGWDAIVQEADIMFPVDTRTHAPSGDTVKLVFGILGQRAALIRDAHLRRIVAGLKR